MADTSEEWVQIKLPEVFVYKIPPKTTAAGHKAADWKDQVWVGKLEVVTRDSKVAVKLIGEDGKIFAVAPVRKDGPPAVEKVSDSSRYFVLRIENDKGQYAFIGLGFNNRSDAFDFNVALQDAQKEADGASRAAELDAGPAIGDLSLKAGEKISIKVNIGGAHKPATAAAPAAAATGGGLLKLRAPGAAATAAAPAPAAASSSAAAAAAGDDFLGLSSLSLGAGTTAAAPAKPAAPAPASSWETF